MGIERHGLSIGIERSGEEIYLTLKAIGKLTHEDYQIINPMLDSTLQGIGQPRVKVLVDGTELDGWEARAMWDDLKLGLKHGSEFVKIAIYGNRRWQELSAKIGSWFMSGEVRYFDNLAEALLWLKAES